MSRRDRRTAISLVALGAIGMAFPLLLFADLFGGHPLLVIILSLPPILAGLYILHNRFDLTKTPSRKLITTFVKRNKHLILINCLFLVLCLPLTRATPYIANTVGAPDEWQHYGKNVEFMLDKQRLPVAGQDDVDSLRHCRDNPYGKVPCRYSYQFTPAFNYIVSALFAEVGSFVGLSELTGARLASVMWGLAFLNMLYLLCRLFLRKQHALFLTFAVGFIPQIIFISSYVNQDIHSLAISTALLFATLGYFVFGKKKLRWLLYASFGLLFTAKYNYILMAIVPAYFLWRSVWPKRDWLRLRREVVWLGGSALVLAGFWYIRNFALYGDFLGQSFILQEMAKYHPLGKAWSPFNPRSYLLLLQFDVFHSLLRSFFAQFGYLYITLNQSFYMLIQFGLILGAIVLGYFSSKQARIVLFVATGFLGLAFLQVTYNAFIYDFQFQGRYLYVALPAMAAGIAYALADIDRRTPQITTGFLLGSLSLTTLLVVESVLVLAMTLVTFKG